MRTTFRNFLTLNALNVIPAIYWILLAIYAGLLVVTFWSIWAVGAKTSVTRAAWSLVILAAPVAGMFVYCLWCLMRSDLGALRQIGIVTNKPTAR